MKISIFGMGYVGIVSAVCLAKQGHMIIGVDVNKKKVEMINSGSSPIIEKDVDQLLSEAAQEGRIKATMDTAQAIADSEVSFISVGTPSRANGSLDTVYLENVCKEIGACLKGTDCVHILVFRSTMLPGTMQGLLIPLLEKYSEKRCWEGFQVAYNPEFLREGTAVDDFAHPPKTVVGSDVETVADQVLDIYAGLPGPMIRTSLQVAEMVKYVDNNFHALKIVFANEVGSICKELKIDSHDIMKIFVQDTKLNLSPYYLKPGFAFGGSCLPKDLRAINYLAKTHDLDIPLLNALIPSNETLVRKTVQKIIGFGKKKIGVAGFSFKAGTDDLRESPLIEVIETLIGKGYELKLYDKNVSVAKLIGANKEYIEERIPHISSLMVDSLKELIEGTDLIVIGNKDQEFEGIPNQCRKEQIVYDLVRIHQDVPQNENYEGISW